MGECGCHLDVRRCRDHDDDVVVVLEGGRVTDEMAERAARAWEEDFDSYDEDFKADALADARRALTAALTPDVGPKHKEAS